MIHKFSMMGTNIVVDVNSGAVHVVDDISFDILDYYKNFTAGEIKNKLAHKYNADEIDEALREIESLEAEGLLFPKTLTKSMFLPWTESRW